MVVVVREPVADRVGVGADRDEDDQEDSSWLGHDEDDFQVLDAERTRTVRCRTATEGASTQQSRPAS
jgi:hypothetical protein